MISLKDISLNISEKDYHNYPAWSYSLIARYAKDGFGALAVLHEPFEVTPSMEFGSLFDSIITKGKKTLDEYVVDTTGINIPPAEKSVFDKLIELGYGEYSFDNLCSMHTDALNSAINSCETFCSKYKKEDTRRAKLAENAEYYELHRKGKKVVSASDWQDAMDMYKGFTGNKYTNALFGKSSDKVEYIYQAQFVTDYTLPSGKTVKMKIMPDLIEVDHEHKTIQPVDLKTCAMPAYAFSENFVKYRYDLQAECYTDIIKAVLPLEYAGYDVLPYLFTAISRTDNIPVTYVYDPSNGFSFTKNGKTYEYKGWKELLDEILDYEEKQAKVPSYISIEKPNDIISILSK